MATRLYGYSDTASQGIHLITRLPIGLLVGSDDIATQLLDTIIEILDACFLINLAADCSTSLNLSADGSASLNLGSDASITIDIDGECQ